jgi:hypothetical protein
MKKLFIAGFAFLSLNAFSQSYIILNNGVTLTTDKAGLVYDFDIFNLPYNVSISGGQFLVSDEKVSTVTEKGFFFKTDVKVKKVKGKGFNYMITDNSDIITISAAGLVTKLDKDTPFKKPAGFGGNYLTVQNDKKKTIDLYTVSDKGFYFNPTVPGLVGADIIPSPGNYITTRTGAIFTVARDGLVYSKAGQYKIGAIRKAGGNFFIDSANFLFTVTDAGFLMCPILPKGLVVSNIVKVGANYMIDQDGKLFVVDGTTGLVSERVIKDHDLRNAKILSI